MATFLVRVRLNLPTNLTDTHLSELVAAERERGRDLIAAGSLTAIWRIPGRSENVSLYRVADASELHSVLSSLPLFPWMSIDVEALADHPLMVSGAI